MDELDGQEQLLPQLQFGDGRHHLQGPDLRDVPLGPADGDLFGQDLDPLQVLALRHVLRQDDLDGHAP